MILDVLRHGATASTEGHRFNDEGEPLLDATIAALAAVDFNASVYDRIDVSSLPRAVQTAEHLRLPRFDVDSRLAERGLGVFQGLTASQCRERFAADLDAFNQFEADYCIPGGESRGAHLGRVLAWLEEVATCGAGRALAITHGGVVDFLKRLGQGQPIHGGSFDGGDLLGLSRFEVTWPGVRLINFSQGLPA
jgi:probable phosphoglycerate mutase